MNWDLDCEKVLREVKKTLANLPMLHPPRGTELLLYVASSKVTTSAVLTNKPEKRTKNQKPIDYHSKVLKGAKQRYSYLEKLSLQVVLRQEN